MVTLTSRPLRLLQGTFRFYLVSPICDQQILRHAHEWLYLMRISEDVPILSFI
jgi:hypothetical protein